MLSAMAAVRANARFRQITKEKERIINLFASSPNIKCRAVTKVVRRILLNGPYLLNDKLWEVKAKSLGAGVHELTLKEIRDV